MRVRRRFASVAAAGALAVLSSSAGALADFTPPPPPSPSSTAPALPVQVTLGGIHPLAPQPGDTLTVRGRLTNLGEETAANLTVQLLVSRSKVSFRGDFDQYADDPTGEQPIDASAPPSEQVTLPHMSLSPAESETFTISLPVDDLQLPESWQVYKMAIVATADTTLGHVQVGRLRSFLPWAPIGQPGTGEPTRLAWVWPLIDRPHRSDGGAWMDDELAASLAPGGRLGRLLDAADIAEHQQPRPVAKPTRTHGKKHRPVPTPKPKPTVQSVPVTWALDPALVEDVRDMRPGYVVQSPDGTQAGAGKAAASRWLAQLQRDVATTEFFAVPYADPDVTAAAHAGLGQEVQNASTQGNTTIGMALGRQPLPYAWPPDGLADQHTLSTYFGAGETTVVLDSAALPIIGGQPSQTPSAHTQVTAQATETFQALLADDALNRAVDEGAAANADWPLSVQRLMSELLMIEAEAPFSPRSLVITPDRRWDPPSGYAAALLADSGKVPWIEPVSLPAVANTPVDESVKRPLLDYPSTERHMQLSRPYLAGVEAIRRLVGTFADVVAPATPQPVTNPLVGSFNAGVLRLLSSAWRADPALATTTSNALLDEVQHTMARVHIASRGSSLVTLTSHSGTVPVTVANDLDVPVSVVVKVQPDQHLVIRSGRMVQIIPPHRQFPVDIHATAQTSGVFGLTVQLTTESGKPYGAPVPLRIRSTAYGTTALLITGGATAVLLLTVMVRLIRRARATRRNVAAPA